MASKIGNIPATRHSAFSIQHSALNPNPARNEIVVCQPDDAIQSRILTLRGVQVLLDRDLAMLFGVPTKVLNQAVKRNANRFPERFMFRLTNGENAGLRSRSVTSNATSAPTGEIAFGGSGGDESLLRSQIVTSKAGTRPDSSGRGGSRYLPHAFTEHGVAMLASVLNSPTAIAASIRIIDAFVAMRRFLVANAEVFRRIETVEHRQTATDAKVDAILARLDSGEPPPRGVFFAGQLWDARSLVEGLVARAKTSILLIDSWVGPGTLDILAKKRTGVAARIVTSQKGNKIAATDIATFNAQYPTLAVQVSKSFHDRFLILDDKELYLVGASLKDLGAKCFAFSKMDASAIPDIKSRI